MSGMSTSLLAAVLSGRPAGAPGLPLDSLSSVAASWSVSRRLRTAYTGPLIRVRRSMDNAEQDIGYTATNDLDTTALLNFVGVPARPLDFLSVSAAAAYGPRRLRTAYTGPALRVRRSGDDAEQDIGFDGSGNLDTAALLDFAGRQNLLLWSQDLTNAIWTPSNATVAGDVAQGLDGTTTADRITSSSNAAAGYAQIVTMPAGAFTFSTYVLPGTSPWHRLAISNNAIVTNAYFNLSAITVGTVDAGLTASITDAGGGWRRLTVTRTLVAGATTFFLRLANGDGITVSTTGHTAIVWGSQVNAGSTALPYAATTTAARTGDGFVTTLYDQSGNGRNATQTTVANQPQIVVAGVLATLNGRTVLRGINGTSSLTLASVISGLTDYTISTVLQKTASTNDIIFGNAALNEQLFRINSSNNPHTFWGTNVVSTTVWDVTTNPGVANFVRSGTTVTPYLNGAAGAAMTQTLGAVTFSGIGAMNNSSAFLGALVGEVLVFSSALSTVDRQILEQSQSVYYGITYAPGLPSGFVTTLYDQSGNSVNATQTTVANQPRIVNAGAIAANINGRPAVAGDGVDDGLTFPLTGMTAYPLSTNIVVSGTSTNNLGCWVKIGGTTNGVGIGQGNSDFSTPALNIRILKEQVAWMATSTPVAASAVISYVQPPGATASTLFQNGLSVSITNSTTIPLAPTVTGTLIGMAAGSRFSTNPISEIVIFNSALSTADRQTLEREQGSYYGITVA